MWRGPESVNERQEEELINARQARDEKTRKRRFAIIVRMPDERVTSFDFASIEEQYQWLEENKVCWSREGWRRRIF